MSRIKAYNKKEVTQKAMNLFWKNGYNTTSMQMLEKEMGINKYSIYDSFGSKEGLLEESIKCYAQKLNSIIEKLKKSSRGIVAIKQYFFDFKDLSVENDIAKGCFVTNTANELMDSCNNAIKILLTDCTNKVRTTFAQKLLETGQYSFEEIEEMADYLIVAMAGFSSATKMFSAKQVDNYLQQIFKNI
ncbi:TetR/AcrR family transcriptional regulator [Marinifilum sp. RC60d5]|uniref:TetR/AcrR family transcriptional regulator n=1 Tax=Marinifilum sp. RC60d5 TaxID=3458414 RepID=UPI00403555EB